MKNLKLSELLEKKAKILEQDARGAKVLLFEGKIFKFFYNTRHPIRGYLRPKAKLFAKNCIKLNKKGILAPNILSVYFDKKVKASVVVYPLLEGIAIRDITNINNKTIIKLANFMFELHKKGIMFRSCHLGNILLNKQDDILLIDVADVRFHKFKFNHKKRLRNFRHFTRAIEDKHIFTDNFRDIFLKQYNEKYNKSYNKNGLNIPNTVFPKN